MIYFTAIDVKDILTIGWSELCILVISVTGGLSDVIFTRYVQRVIVAEGARTNRTRSDVALSTLSE